MHNNDEIRLRHMIEAAEDVQQFIAGRHRTELNSDRMLLFALVRAIEIIGEAANKVSDETQSVTRDIPWKAIVGMRNRLIHAYFDINADTVWMTATVEIPAVLVQLKAFMSKMSSA